MEVPVGGGKESTERSTRLSRQHIVRLSIAEQVAIYRTNEAMRPLCDSVWRRSHKRLDFRQLERELSGEPLSFFVNHMMDNYRSAYFIADRLQENLNVLERAGVRALINVHHCKLLLSSSESQRQNDDGDAQQVRVAAVLGGALMPQWPLHALPKILCNLRRLKVHCDVQVHFIQQFPQLEQLMLCGNVSQSALTGILERCKQLDHLFIKCPEPTFSLHGIINLSKLQDLSIPMSMFLDIHEKVLSLPELHYLELTKGGQNSEELTIECLGHMLQIRPNDIEIVRLNCSRFKGSDWMRELDLQRCGRLQGLVLNNCRFHERKICNMNMPYVANYLVLSGCPDLSDSQLVDMIKKCSHLSELYLIDCPLLNGQVLYEIYRIRHNLKLDYPLSIILDQCELIKTEYQKAADFYNCGPSVAVQVRVRVRVRVF
ncbi:GH12725 [Drosophila grimshawi]|uniref:GH12725 n=1 Tax=Drosophila grimshawi TaxID=7222 RepID=B4JKS6_DROGR|nr:GH12725 [Drosophila grimshawi]